MNPSPFHPEPIEIVTADNLPVRVRFKKRMQTVREISNAWRVDDGWWLRPVSRMYYVLELNSGSRITVFRDLLNDKWYRQNWTA